MGSDRMLLRHVYHKPFTDKFPDKCEWQDGSTYQTDGAQEGGTTVFQTEIYAIKSCLMENVEKGYTGRNIYILSDSQTAIKALDSCYIDSNLV